MHRQALDSLPHFGVSTRAQTLADKLAQHRNLLASPGYRQRPSLGFLFLHASRGF